jgi:altronate dehydratase small subunit
MAIALHVNEKDNVATVFENGVIEGQSVTVLDKTRNITAITVRADIPYGHKIAICDIHRGEPITKYGEQIGVATSEIRLGEHVHVHNLDSTRGRGDQ